MNIIIKETNESLTELYAEKQIILHKIEQNNKILDTMRSLECSAHELQEKIEKLCKLCMMYDKYRAWLYEHHILPQLVFRTNQYVQTVEPSLSLDYKIHDDGTFTFCANNSHSQVSLEKTSGFEYFILSISIRLAFITLTLCSDGFGGELIIDEGFTNCDTTHLSRIPKFLQSLLGKFDSILLVSHLERIKDSVDNTICIQNHTLQYGNKYAFIKPTVVKNRKKV